MFESRYDFLYTVYIELYSKIMKENENWGCQSSKMTKWHHKGIIKSGLWACALYILKVSCDESYNMLFEEQTAILVSDYQLLFIEKIQIKRRLNMQRKRYCGYKLRTCSLKLLIIPLF